MQTGANAVDWLLSGPERTWNKEVSDFCADLIGHSQSVFEVEDFLTRLVSAHGGVAEKVQGKWIVKLPGWEGRV